MATQTGCAMCGKTRVNFGDSDEGVKMWIDDTGDGYCVIAVDSPYAWSIPINYCPYCGRNLMKTLVIDE